MPGSWTTSRSMFMSGSSMRCLGGTNGTRAVIFSMRLRVTWMCMPSITGAAAPGVTWSLCSSGAPIPTSRSPTLAAARWTLRTAPPSLSSTVLALTTGRAIPASGTRLPRVAAACGLRGTAASRGRGWRRVGHRELGQRLVDGGIRRPDLFGVLTVQRDLQRSAAPQHDVRGVGDPFASSRVEVVTLADVEPVFPDDVDHPRLHGCHGHCGSIDAQRDRLIVGDGIATGEGQDQDRK